MKRHTGTFDSNLLDEIRREVGPGRVSRFLNDAAKERLARIRLLRALDELDEKYGEPTPEEIAQVEAEALQAFGA